MNMPITVLKFTKKKAPEDGNSRAKMLVLQPLFRNRVEVDKKKESKKKGWELLQENDTTKA